MNLVKQQVILSGKGGFVRYKFRPSSPLCPVAVPLSLMIRDAIAAVPGVNEQDMQIVGYLQAEKLTHLLREMMEDKGSRKPEEG